MAIFSFSVKEINYGALEIEANDVESAKKKAEEEYHKGNTVWGDFEYEIELDE